MNDKITISIKNGKDLEIIKGTKYYELLDLEGLKDVIGIRVNNELVSLETKINNKDKVEFIYKESITGYKIYQAGVKFVLEVALKETFGKNYEVIYNHSIERGVHLSIKSPKPFTKEDTLKLKESMQRLIASDEKIKRLNIDRSEAIQYYKLINEKEKSTNIHNVTNQVVTLYKLRNYVNYYYIEMPYSTKILQNFDLKYLADNELVLLFPSRHKKNIEPYNHYEKVIENYKSTEMWITDQQVSYQSDLNEMVSNYQIEDLIKNSEMFFNINIQKTVEDIINKQAKYVLIAGPSSSGKTTTAKKIALNLRALGLHPFTISIDDFFKERQDSPKDENGNYDFECLEAIDTELLSTTLNDLIEGKSVAMPRFDFVTGKKVFDKVVTLPSNSIILMEGLHCLNDALTPTIDTNLKYKIYLSPFMAINVDRHNYISSTDVRIIRRIVRDRRTRNRGVDQTIAYLDTLRIGEEKYIYPFLNQADVIINTALPYEIGVLKVYAEPLLYSIDVSSPYYEEARRLINFLKGFFPIPSEYVNDDSIIREFIGGSIFE